MGSCNWGTLKTTHEPPSNPKPSASVCAWDRGPASETLHQSEPVGSLIGHLRLGFRGLGFWVYGHLRLGFRGLGFRVDGHLVLLFSFGAIWGRELSTLILRVVL